MPPEENQIPPEGGAGEALAAGAPEAKAKSVSLPSDLLPDAKPGDTFKVQAVTDGNVTLEHMAAPQGEGETPEAWGEGLKEAAPRMEEE